MEAVRIINIKPKKINSEIVFNSRELCSLILSLDSDENWFNNKIIDCKLESQINRKELERKLKYYHKNFIDILKGDYIPK